MSRPRTNPIGLAFTALIPEFVAFNASAQDSLLATWSYFQWNRQSGLRLQSTIHPGL